MRIKVINPNTSQGMTDTIADAARGVVAAGTEIEAVSPSMGPASIESHYDEALAVPGVLDEIRIGERDGVDGYVIACFGDPGLDAAREVARGPVVGIAEAAMHAATFLGRSFSVVTSLERTAGRAWDLVDAYGFRRRCTGVRAVDIDVLAIADSASHAYERLEHEAIAARDGDGADSIVLGCAGLADLCARLSAAIGIPVLDGVAAATVTVEGLVRMGAATSKRLEFSRPPAKTFAGILSRFSH